MSARPTQRERVLRFLEVSGDRGTSWLDWSASPPDGGRPIAHLAGVIRQLKNDGHVIESVNARTSTGAAYARYRLVVGVGPDPVNA